MKAIADLIQTKGIATMRMETSFSSQAGGMYAIAGMSVWASNTKTGWQTRKETPKNGTFADIGCDATEEDFIKHTTWRSYGINLDVAYNF